MKLSLPESALMWVLICIVSHYEYIKMEPLSTRNSYMYSTNSRTCDTIWKGVWGHFYWNCWGFFITSYLYISSTIGKFFNLHVYVLHNYWLWNHVCCILFNVQSLCVPAANSEDSSCWSITIYIYLWSLHFLSSIWILEYVHGSFCCWNEALVQGTTSFALQLHSKPLLVCYTYYPFDHPLPFLLALVLLLYYL